jgi:hypothetical protein
VNSYTELEISRLKREIAEIERQSAVVKAEAEMESSQLRAATTQERSFELLKLETYEEAIKRWNGALPPISPKPGQTIVIGKDGILGGTR